MKIRAIIDGKEVVGWLFKAYKNYYLIPDGIQLVESPHITKLFGCVTKIDIALCAEDTGRDDKHFKRIFGSRDKMQGGDRVRVGKGGGMVSEAYWNNGWSAWSVGASTLGLWKPDELEIVTDTN